jgi:hypothetical protein
MQFEGADLRFILRQQEHPTIEVYDRNGMLRGAVTPQTALTLCSGTTNWFGVGSLRRIRFLRSAVGCPSVLNVGSITTLGRDDRKQHHRRHCAAFGGLPRECWSDGDRGIE